MTFPPREGDLPRGRLMLQAQTFLTEAVKQGRSVKVYFKATCPNCGNRCIFKEPNRIFDSVECECGTTFPFTVGGWRAVYAGGSVEDAMADLLAMREQLRQRN